MSRKDVLASLTKAASSTAPQSSGAAFAADMTNSGEVLRSARIRMRPILGSPDLITDPSASPIGAIGQSLGELYERNKRAEEIEQKLTAGETIIELDPAMVDPSFVVDRMPATADTLANLIEAIREQGQLNPILVRPHPEAAGRFQVAFGHRRLRAASSLGRPIKAVVRNLTDVQLVIAQGQENHERKDLSYIEKALFAYRLNERFNRDTITAAMSLYKSDLSNMLTVATKIPHEIISKIGPAPNTGRRGWIELADHLAKGGSIEAAQKIIGSESYQHFDSDERFQKVLAVFKPQPLRSRSENLCAPGGKSLAKVTQNDNRVQVTVDRRKSPEFANFLISKLQVLFKEFEAELSNTNPKHRQSKVSTEPADASSKSTA